ncbi:hypothetical protein MHU86_5323 [Fragilaria crotonensis]|nr:hypothetical protein MHU86_5323 [Fragilaria crotonensis]
MERSENKKKQHAITPYPESHSAPRDKRRKLTYRQCDCGLQFCQKGDIQATLEELNCHELLEFKQVYACNNPSTHNQRKHFAFRKSVEFHLKIPLDLVQTGKRYYIHKFHWPIVLVQKRFATTSLLNAKCIKNIEDQQRLLYGITNEALGESRNTYGNLARDVLVGLTLSRDEMLDLHLQVQAPVASRNDIIACIQTLSSERSQRHNIRSHLGDAVPTSESAIVSQHIIGEAQSCPKVSCSPSFERETVDDQPLLVLCATSPTSPLAPRTLLPPTPQSEIVTTPDTIVRKLRQRFQNHLPAYSSEDIPDVDVRNTFDLLSRRDAERNQIFSDFLKARNEINANAATTSYQVENIFEGIDSSCLSPGYRRLHDILVGNAKQRLGMKGFLGLLLGNEKDFVATAKASIFTVNESWYKSLYSLEGDDEMNFNSACSCILLILFQNLYEASAFNRKHVLSSYHHRLYKMMKERNHVAWKIVIDKLPTCLRLKDAPVCLLIQCLSDILLEWVYDAMSARLSEKKIEREAIASSRQSNATNTVDNSQDVIMSQVQRFFGWSIFSLKRKLENEQCDNKDGLDLLEKMSVFHHEVINDELYMKNCYPIANEVMNKGGLTLVATNFIGFGRSLMTMVKKLTIETVLQKGNRAIEDLVSDVLHSEKLKRIFWSCCETSYSNERRETQALTPCSHCTRP